LSAEWIKIRKLRRGWVFGHRSPVLSEVEVFNQLIKENKGTGMIADNQKTI
jgi:hypothetical protein|tara:strand:- start:868 stop:1020 length:153 start_codon:yes stop_codon:yes gene_type:complete